MFGGYDDFYIKQGDPSKNYGIHWYPVNGPNYW